MAHILDYKNKTDIKDTLNIKNYGCPEVVKVNKVRVLALDMGNYNYKDNNGVIIPAKVSKTESILNDKEDFIDYQGERYFIGTGELEINLDKANKANSDVLMLAVLDQYEETFFKLVIGLPTSYYKSTKDILSNKLLETRIFLYKNKSGEEKQKIIEDVLVFPEGAGAYFSIINRPKNAVIIDIGGKTCNLVSFSGGKLDSTFTTLGEGMIDLYSKIRDYLNQKYVLKLCVENIEVILKEGLVVDGLSVDMNFIKPIIAEYIEKILNELRLNFPIRTHKIFICGGGASILGKVLKRNLINSEILGSYLFSNAQGFYKVGVSKWQ